MSSIIDSWNRYRAAEEDLHQSGQESVFVKRVTDRIQRVVDSWNGKRTFRNTWGLLPIRSQELFHWKDGGDIFPSETFVGGKYLSIPTEMGELGETLVEKAIQEFGGYELESDSQTGLGTHSIKRLLVLKSPKGILYERSVYRENRVIKRGDEWVEEFIPGFPSTYAIYWHASFPVAHG